MKKVLAIGFLVFTSFSVYAKFVYDADDQKVVDAENGWEFKATLKNTDELYLDGTGCSYSGSSPCSLDLTEITDADGKTYKAVSFKALPEAAKPYLTEFIAPDCQKIEGENCFKGCTELLTVELNGNVTYIAAWSFYNCTKLETFTPRTLNVGYLYNCTFRECTSLAGSFDMPNCIKISNMAFSGCAKIESVSAANVTDVGESSFSGCSRLSNVSFPKITSIANSAFSRCASLSNESLDGLLHKSIKQLGSNAIDSQEWLFSGCTAITGPIVWNLPSLTTNVVAKGMFNNCTSLKEVRFVTDVARIKDRAFHDIASGASIYMPLTAPAVYGERAVSRSSGNYPKVYLKGNHDEWLDVMRQHHSVILKEDFNNSDKWVLNGSDATKEKIRDAMINDSDMCKEEDGVIKLRDRNVIAFVAYFATNNNIGFCWVLKIPEQGFRVIVR